MKTSITQKIIDISWPLAEQMTVYKDNPAKKFIRQTTVTDSGVVESTLTLPSHTGTHIDAPLHMILNGGAIENVPLSSVIGSCRVVEIGEDIITAETIKKIKPRKKEILLLKTKNSFLSNDAPFNPNFVFVDKSAAKELARCGVTAVGIDYLGIERTQPNHETHLTLMNASITIIEGLRLLHVKPGTYELICLPLSVIGADAAPCRAMLRRKRNL